MDQNKTAIERAFELAQSGTVTSVAAVKRTVVLEGYRVSQLEGRSLTRQLNALIRLAAEAPRPV